MFTTPLEVGKRRFPPIGLVVLAAIGAFLLFVVATTSWSGLTDEQAYWRAAERFAAGGSMYDPAAVPGDASYGYWYPPPLVQVLAPFTGVITGDLFAVAWTALLLTCLWWLGGRNFLVALALIAFLPVAIELRFRNIHLVLAVLAVFALRHSVLFWIPAAAIKVAPVIGVAYLIGSRRYRDATLVMAVGGLVLAASYVLAPAAWADFLSLVVTQGPTSGASILPIPFPIRAAAGLGLAVLGGVATVRGRQRRGEALLMIGIVLANPTLWATALSMLVAIVPLWRTAQPAGNPAVRPA